MSASAVVVLVAPIGRSQCGEKTHGSGGAHNNDGEHNQAGHRRDIKPTQRAEQQPNRDWQRQQRTQTELQRRPRRLLGIVHR